MFLIAIICFEADLFDFFIYLLESGLIICYCFIILVDSALLGLFYGFSGAITCLEAVFTILFYGLISFFDACFDYCSAVLVFYFVSREFFVGFFL